MSEPAELQAGITGDKFWEVVRGILMRQGLTQADAGALLNVAQSRVSQLSNPTHNPTQETMIEVAETFGFHLYFIAVPRDA